LIRERCYYVNRLACLFRSAYRVRKVAAPAPPAPTPPRYLDSCAVVEAVACAKLGNRAKGDNGKTGKLHKLIDLMHTGGLITRDIRDNAHEIRHFGNYGAEIQDDGLDMVSESEVDDVEEVTWQLLFTLYVAPAAAKRLRDKRFTPKA
jgi:hypothetical protein